jgi:hypothetical protein
MPLETGYRTQTTIMTPWLLLALLVIPSQVVAHDLVVVKEGQELNVDHKHECIERIVEGIGPDGKGQLYLDHLKALSEPQKAFYRHLWDRWMKKYGDKKVKRQSPPTRDTNCHGLTFDEGKSWIDDPAPFLGSDACKKVEPPAKPQKGDVVVYKHAGKITHTGKVIDTPKGQKGLWVHSQFGEAGDFDHPVGNVPQAGQKTEVDNPNKPGTTAEVSATPYGKPTEYYRCN